MDGYRNYKQSQITIFNVNTRRNEIKVFNLNGNNLYNYINKKLLGEVSNDVDIKNTYIIFDNIITYLNNINVKFSDLIEGYIKYININDSSKNIYEYPNTNLRFIHKLFNLEITNIKSEQILKTSSHPYITFDLKIKEKTESQVETKEKLNKVISEIINTLKLYNSNINLDECF
jgi:hypothetical protein